MVKICGITSREDAEASAEAGASALGFNFYPKSPRYIRPESAARIAVPAGILKVGVFVNEPPERVAAVALEAGLDVAQLHGDEAADFPVPGLRVWRAFRVSPEFDARLLEAYDAEAYLLDAPSAAYGGSGAAFDWKLARIPGRRIILAGGLGPDNVAAAVREARPWGVDACSHLEAAPGRKDPRRVKEFILKALEAWQMIQQ